MEVLFNRLRKERVKELKGRDTSSDCTDDIDCPVFDYNAADVANGSNQDGDGSEIKLNGEEERGGVGLLDKSTKAQLRSQGIINGVNGRARKIRKRRERINEKRFKLFDKGADRVNISLRL